LVDEQRRSRCIELGTPRGIERGAARHAGDNAGRLSETGQVKEERIVPQAREDPELAVA